MSPSKIPVFYCDEMCAASGSFSPSPSKPAKAVASWKTLNIPIEIIAPAPLTRDHICKAHGKVYTNAVLDCKTSNGFGNTSPDIARSLPYTSGSMLTAMECALSNGIGAVSPTSGFHHAGFDFGGGYCTFNGLMIAARHHPELQIGILDFDNHYGDGTDDIIQYFQMKNIRHWTYGGVKGRGFTLKRFHRIVERYQGCDIVLYQAGADPHITDPLGGNLTTEQLLERDMIVFTLLRRMGIPVAWNLAGGYNSDFKIVLEIHDNTMKAFAASFFSSVG